MLERHSTTRGEMPNERANGKRHRPGSHNFIERKASEKNSFWTLRRSTHQQPKGRPRSGFISTMGLMEVMLVGVIIWIVTMIVPLLLLPGMSMNDSNKNDTTHPIMRLVVDPSGTKAVIQRGSSEIVSCNLVTNDVDTVFQDETKVIGNLSVSRDVKTCQFTLDDNRMLIYRNHELIVDEDGFDRKLLLCALSADGRTGVVVRDGNKVQLYDLSSEPPNAIDYEIPNRATAVALNPTGRRMAVALESGDVELYESTTGSLLRKFEEPNVQTRMLAISDDEQSLIAMSFHQVTVYDVGSGKSAWSIRTATADQFSNAQFSPDGSKVSVNQVVSGLMVLNRATGSVDHQFVERMAYGKSAFSFAGEKLYMGDVYGRIRIWSLRESREMNSIPMTF